jgi:hypothetical protein
VPQGADGGHDFRRDAEVAKVIEDDQFRVRDQFGSVMGVDNVDYPVASRVEDGDRALDSCDIEGDPARVARNLPRGPACGQAGFLCCSTVLAVLFRIAG